MKILKRIGIGLLALVLLITIIGFFLPSAVHVEESGEMKAAPEVVYAQIADFTQWNNWSPWHEMDTTMKLTFEGEPMTVGHGYSWTSEELGDGHIVFTKLEPYSMLESEMFFRGDEEPAIGRYKLEATETGTKMTLSIDFDMGMNPFGRVFGAVFFTSMMKKDFKRGLEKLKAYTEALPVKPKIEIGEITTTPVMYVSVKYEGAPDMEGMSAQMGQMYGTLQTYLATEKIEMAGAPFAIWHWWSDTLIRFEACLPIAKKIKGNSAIQYGELAASPALKVDHYGAYDKTGDAHWAIDAYAKEKSLKLGDPLEVYVTDPGTEPDTSKWLTQIIYPIQSN